MGLLDAEIVWRPSALISDSTPAQNGGRMAFSLMVSGMKNNLFPDVSQTERTAGATKFRKAFIHLNTTSNAALTSVKVFLDALSPGGDYVTFLPGTATDTEDAATGRRYGVGTLNANVSAAATSCQVLPENYTDYAADTIFRVGDTVRISTQPSTGGAGTTDWVLLSGVTWVGPYATLTFTTTPLANGYTAGTNVIISNAYTTSTVAAGVNTVVKTSTSGTFDSATVGNLITQFKGGVQDAWTITMLTASTYSIAGAASGAIAGSGSISSDYNPINPATGTAYLTVKALCWGGTWIAGDTVTFNTTPASLAIWYRRKIPASTASIASDFASLAVWGESA